jgi:hypothetical protein
MGFGNAMDWLVAWIDSRVQKVGADGKLVRLAHLKATEDVKIKTSARNETMEEFAAVQNQLKIDLKIYKKRGKEALDERKKMKDEMNRQSKDVEIEQHQLNEILTEEEIKDIDKNNDGLKEEVCDAKTVCVVCRDALRKHKMRELGGLGDEDESFVELLHQDGRKNERRLNCVVNYAAKHNNIIIKTMKLGIHQEVVKLKATHREKVKRQSKRKLATEELPTPATEKSEAKEDRKLKRKKFARAILLWRGWIKTKNKRINVYTYLDIEYFKPILRQDKVKEFHISLVFHHTIQ